MVPHDEGALTVSLVHGVQRFGRLDRIGIGNEQRVDMSQRFRTRDLDAFDHDESDLVGPLLGDVERRVQIASRYERFPRADFDMVRDGDGVEAVFPCLVDAHGRPYAAVREDRVRVKVAFEHMETVDIRNPDVVAQVAYFHLGQFEDFVVADLTAQRQRAQKQDRNQNFFHLLFI